jgi:hypothetical protein
VSAAVAPRCVSVAPKCVGCGGPRGVAVLRCRPPQECCGGPQEPKSASAAPKCVSVGPKCVAVALERVAVVPKGVVVASRGAVVAPMRVAGSGVCWRLGIGSSAALAHAGPHPGE